MMGLTPRQRDCLAYLREHIAQHGVAPTYDEIATYLGVRSKSGVNRLVVALAERGAIVRMPNRARAITIPVAAPPEPGTITLSRTMSAHLRHAASVRGRSPEALLAQVLGVPWPPDARVGA